LNVQINAKSKIKRQKAKIKYEQPVPFRPAPRTCVHFWPLIFAF